MAVLLVLLILLVVFTLLEAVSSPNPWVPRLAKALEYTIIVGVTFWLIVHGAPTVRVS